METIRTLLMLGLLTLFAFTRLRSCSAQLSCEAEPITNGDIPPVCTSLYSCRTANAGDNMTIPCGQTAVGQGVELTYQKVMPGGGEVELGTTVGKFLTITLTPEDNGAVVLCVPGTSNNSLTDGPCYQLVVQYKPRRLPNTSTIAHSGHVGTSYCLNCPTDGNPVPNCTWTVYDAGCESKPGGNPSVICKYPSDGSPDCTKVVFKTQPTLSFPSTMTSIEECKEADPGFIQPPRGPYPSCVMLVDELAGVFYDYTIGCNAENALGSYTKNFSRIQFEPCTNAKPDQRILGVGLDSVLDVTVGNSINITCRVTNAHTRATMQWTYFNDTLAYPQFAESYSQPCLDLTDCSQNSTLYLTNVAYSDAGNYTCRYLQSTVVTSLLVVRVVPPPSGSGSRSKSPGTPVIAGGTGGAVALFLIVMVVLLLAAAVYGAFRNTRIALMWSLKEPECEGDRCWVGCSQGETMACTHTHTHMCTHAHTYAHVHTHTDIYKVEGDLKHYKYDVFLSFADSNFTDAKKLRNSLEQRGYEICLHPTTSGTDNPEITDGSILDSRKTLLLLSEDFFKDDLCCRELDVSMEKMKTSRRRCVLPVLLYDTELLSAEVKAVRYMDARQEVRGEEVSFLERLCERIGKPMVDVLQPNPTSVN